MNTIENANSLLLELFESCVENGASDIHLSPGQPVFHRCSGKMVPRQETVSSQQISAIVLRLAGESGSKLLESRGSIDGAIGLDNREGDVHRFRYNLFRSNGETAIAFRRLEERFRELHELGLPTHLHDAANAKDGLILVAGPTGSGKSTTLATLIDHINRSRPAHIITIEDPIEYVHQNIKSKITQRQIGIDTPNFHQAVFDAVRQDPDILLVGELRDLETIENAIQVAETGHLVFATVHSGDCVGAIERLVNVFPGNQQPMVQQLLSSTLKAIVAQHLLPSQDNPGNRVLASEILYVNAAVSNLVRNGNFQQIRSVLETGSSAGMQTLDASLAQLVKSRKISLATARTLARNPKMLSELSRAI